MRKNSEATRAHKAYLRAKISLRDQHQDAYTLMLERHAQELDALWANYNLAVKKLAEGHNKAIRARILAVKKEVKKAIAQKSEEKRGPQKATEVSLKVVPMKKRVKTASDITVEKNSGQNEEVIDAITLVSERGPARKEILPNFLGFMGL